MSAAGDAFYTQMANTAQALITKFGKDVTLTHVTTGAFDAAAGESVGDTSADQVVPGFLKKVTQKQKEAFPDVELSGALLIAGADLTSEPEVTDTATVEGKGYSILDITPLRPNTGFGLIYELLLGV